MTRQRSGSGRTLAAVITATAALALGAFGRPSGLSSLAVLLHDEHPVVQVSAAAAILEVVPPEEPRLSRLDGPAEGNRNRY